VKVEIDIKKATKKWNPVLDTLKVKEYYKEKISEYAEHHQLVENLNNINNTQNYLPVSIKILSELEFDIRLVNFTMDNQIDHYYEIDITQEQIKQYIDSSHRNNRYIWQKSNSLAFVQDLKKQLIEKVKTDIHNKINNSESIDINMIVKNIYIDEKEKKMIAVSNYKVRNRTKKLERILKIN